MARELRPVCLRLLDVLVRLNFPSSILDPFLIPACRLIAAVLFQNAIEVVI